MDVSCPKCQTIYEFDESQIRAGAVTLKCSQCQYLFRLESSTSVTGENQRRWMVRTEAGDILYFATFSVLHRWIMEGSVGPKDAISRTGKRWTALGQIGEFMPIFQVVESIASLSGQGSSADLVDSKPVESRAESSALKRSQTPMTSPAIDGQRLAPRSYDTPAAVTSRPAASQPIERDGPQVESRMRPMDTPVTRSRAETPAPKGRAGGSAPRALPPAPMQREASKPRVQLEDPRLVSAAQEDDWTLGELDLASRPGPTVTEGVPSLPSSQRGQRKLPVLLGLIALIAGLSFWAWIEAETLTSWWADLQEPTVVSLGEPTSNAPGPEALPGEGEAEVVLARAEQVARAIDQERIKRAVVTARTGLHEAVDPALSASNRAHRPDFGTLISRGNAALQSGDAERARRLFHQAIEYNRNSPEAITGLGWALLELGSADAAAAQFQRALHRDGAYGEAYIGLGRAERSRGNLAEALRAYETYLQRQPHGSQASIARFQSEQLREQLGR